MPVNTTKSGLGNCKKSGIGNCRKSGFGNFKNLASATSENLVFGGKERGKRWIAYLQIFGFTLRFKVPRYVSRGFIAVRLHCCMQKRRFQKHENGKNPRNKTANQRINRRAQWHPCEEAILG